MEGGKREGKGEGRRERVRPPNENPAYATVLIPYN